MRQLSLQLAERSYNIYIKQGLINNDASLFIDHCNGDKVLLLSNQVVAPLYMQQLQQAYYGKNIFQQVIADGESQKNLTRYSEILDFLITNKFRRNDTLVALGGGVIGDLGGFVAACYQRGMGFIQVPTTLLAQVDSSVGGKTAVNHRLGKNMIGAFYQPQAVFIDSSTLDSLPQREFVSGLAEVAKYALLGEIKIKQLLTDNPSAILARDKSLLEELIYLSCAKKAQIVAEDEKEKASRVLLNLGHTFAHAIEKATEYQHYLHGEAVALGMLMAINLSLAKKQISQSLASEYKQLLRTLGLPEMIDLHLSTDELLSAMQLDKKNLNNKYRFVLPSDNGCIVVQEDDNAKVRRAIEAQFK